MPTAYASEAVPVSTDALLTGSLVGVAVLVVAYLIWATSDGRDDDDDR